MINEMNLHYAFTNPATVHDEEALTALELAGRQGAKINEVIRDQNDLRSETESHLENQDATIATRMAAQDSSIKTMREVTLPSEVKQEFQKNVTNGTFENMIDTYAGELEARVDSLLGSVSEGSTTMDAEVIDIRTDADGNVYENAGASVRGQVKRVTDKLVSSEMIIKPEYDVNMGYFIKAGGGLAEAETFGYSSPFDVPAGYTIRMVGSGYSTNVAMISRYQNGNLEPVVMSTDNVVREYTYENESSGQFVVCWRTTDESDLSLTMSMGNIVSLVNENMKPSKKLELTMNNNFVTFEGKFVESDVYKHSDPVYIPSGYHLSFIAMGYNKNVSMISRYENGNYIPVIVCDVSVLKEYTLDILEGGYYVFSCHTGHFYNAVISTDVYELGKEIDKRTYENVDIIPLSVFLNIGIVGDSFASGEVYYDDKLNDRYEYSWGQNIARKNGVSCVNFTRGGMSTRTWLTSPYGKTLMEETDPQNLYLLCLGLNDEGYYGLEYLGTIDDVETGADTFYGNYGSIIKAIKNHAPHSKIVMSTMIATREARVTFNEAIIEIANYFELPYIVQAEDSFFESPAYTDYKVSSHPNVIAYGGMANAIERLLQKCIINNLDYFADTMMHE